MEAVAGSANNDIADEEESTGSVPSLLFSGTMPKKRLRSKVWDDLIPRFVDGKIAGARCTHCSRTFNCTGTTGTTSLWNHVARCGRETQKRPRQQEHTSLPSAQKGTTDGSDPKLSRQTRCADKADAMPVQQIVLADIATEKNRKNQEVDRNGCHEELAEPELSADHNQKNNSHEQTALSEKDIPGDSCRKNQKVDQNCSPEEFVRILAIHGHLPRMMEKDGFWKLFACLDPMVKMPSHDDLMRTTRALFQLEKAKLKEKLAALRCRVCLSAYIWHHNPHLAFLCLTVHYIDDEWENQQKIIKFSPVDSSCSAKDLSDIILGAIKEWSLDGKVFSIILDDAFVDDSVASDVKASLQKSNNIAASQSLFVVRYASHLLDQVIQVGLDELEKIKEITAKCSKYEKDPSCSKVWNPNCRNAPSPKGWERAKNICEILENYYMHVDLISKFRRPAYLFDTMNKVFDKADFYSRLYKSDETFSNVLEKIKQKFKERWNFCFPHFCLPLVMDPGYSLIYIKPHIRNNSKYDYIHKVCDTFLGLFNEYSDQVDDPNCFSGSITSKGTVLDEDTLSKYYHDSKNHTCERPMTELCQYLHEQHTRTRKPSTSVLQWWKEHSLTYPTIARMARDILALPRNSDCNVATRTAVVAMCGSTSERHIEMLVCTQDWLTPAGAKSVESTNDI